MKGVPMMLRKDAGKSLIKFTDNVGIPDLLLTDSVTKFTSKGTEFVKEAWCMHIHLHTTKQGQKNQNHAAKREIGMLTKHWKLHMAMKNMPKHLWGFGLVYKAKIMSRMACGSDNHTGYEEVKGQMPNISEWLDFEFYDLVWWLDHPMKHDVTDYVHRLAWWLGISHCIGSDLCYWLITDTGKIISKSSVEHVMCNNYLNEDKKQQINNFKQKLSDLLHDNNFQLDDDGEFDSMYLDNIEDDPVFNPGVTYPGIEPPVKDYGDMVVEEELPANMPEPCGNLVTISALMDVNHAGNVVMHHSHTGILIFVQNALIIWFLKRQEVHHSWQLNLIV